MSIEYCGCSQLKDFYEKKIIRLFNHKNVELLVEDYGDIDNAMSDASFVSLSAISPQDGLAYSLPMKYCPICGSPFG